MTYRGSNSTCDDQIALVLGDGFETGVELPAYPDGYADNHGRNGYAGQEGDTDRGAD